MFNCYSLLFTEMWETGGTVNIFKFFGENKGLNEADASFFKEALEAVKLYIMKGGPPDHIPFNTAIKWFNRSIDPKINGGITTNRQCEFSTVLFLILF